MYQRRLTVVATKGCYLYAREERKSMVNRDNIDAVFVIAKRVKYLAHAKEKGSEDIFARGLGTPVF